MREREGLTPLHGDAFEPGVSFLALPSLRPPLPHSVLQRSQLTAIADAISTVHDINMVPCRRQRGVEGVGGGGGGEGHSKGLRKEQRFRLVK